MNHNEETKIIIDLLKAEGLISDSENLNAAYSGSSTGGEFVGWVCSVLKEINKNGLSETTRKRIDNLIVVLDSLYPKV